MADQIDPNDVKRLFKMQLGDLEDQVLDVLQDADAQTKSAVATVGPGEEPKKGFLKQFFASKIKGPSKKYICVELKYCERINSDGVKLAIDIADAIVRAKVMIAIGVPIPAVKFAVYLVRSRVLDPLCECK